MATSHFFIGGGAEHTAEMVRRDTYAKLRGAEGICEATDLRVLPLAVPGGGVRVTLGSGYMVSRAAGAVRESYMGSVVTQETVTVPATGSGGGRSDLIVMRVHDPYVEGSPWPDPGAGLSTNAAATARANAKYVYVERIASVPSGTTRLQNVPSYENDTAITLARLDIPASTGTITSTMIKDMREVAAPRRDEVVFARPRVAADDGQQMFLTAPMTNGGEYFPGGAGFANQFTVRIPSWATRMVLDSAWMSVMYAANVSPYGRYWLEFGTEYRAKGWANKQDYEFATQEFWFNAPLTNDEKSDSWLLADEVPVPAKLRGRDVTFVFKAGLENATAGKVWMTSLAGLKCRLTFAERAVDTDII